MKKYAKLTLAVAAMVLLSAGEVSAWAPPGHVGGPVRRGPSIGTHGPSATGVIVRPHGVNPVVRRPLSPLQHHLAIPPGGTSLTTGQGPWHQHAVQVRNNLRGRYNHVFTPSWYARHPNAWCPRHPHRGFWTAVVAWPVLANWVGIGGDYPYDYGTVYESNTYYVTDEGTPVEQSTEAVVTEDAADLASQGDTSQPQAKTDSDEWLPLGVFAIAPLNSNATPDRLFQFTVSRNGVIRGSYYDTLAGQAVPLTGAINKQTQRAAWTIGPNQETIMETNLGGFTADQAKVLVHHGKGHTEQWMMMRLEGSTIGQTGQPTGQTGQQSTVDPTQAAPTQKN